MNEFVGMLLQAVISGGMLFLGIFLGARMSARAIRKEVQEMLEHSETLQFLKKFLTDQTLIENATKFFKEATALVSSPEAKNFFANATKLLQQLGGEPKSILKVPKKPS